MSYSFSLPAPHLLVAPVLQQWDATPCDHLLKLQRRTTRTARKLNLTKLLSVAWLASLLPSHPHVLRKRAIRLWDSVLDIPEPPPTTAEEAGAPGQPKSKPDRRAVHVEQVLKIYSQLGEISKDFYSRARAYDQEIAEAEVFKAGRTVWFMAAFQLILGQELRLTDSMFGYNMLYPYTDNIVDDPELPPKEKAAFAAAFRDRLAGRFPRGEAEEDGDQQQQQQTIPTAYVKPFDMVSEIEKQWSRKTHGNVYDGLLLIHDAQTTSAKQIAQGPAELPSSDFLKFISAYKGGASVLAAGWLITGSLSQEQIDFLLHIGLALQLLDDLQDVVEDAACNQRTIFSDYYLRGLPLDEPVTRLINFVHHEILYRPFRGEMAGGISFYVRVSMVRFSTLLILEAAAKMKSNFTPKFYKELESLSPFPFNSLRNIRIENFLLDVVHNQRL